MQKTEKKYPKNHTMLPDDLKPSGGIYVYEENEAGEVTEKWLYPDGTLFQQLQPAE